MVCFFGFFQGDADGWMDEDIFLGIMVVMILWESFEGLLGALVIVRKREIKRLK